ncbi:MAG: beta-ketoacyl-[acyl-carrier-protein] synthase family protein [Phycisphaerales bacterium]|nr:beta-ketoacyl-[acyl-carrier-protein] synthase family protein [Phycisphaerales bacterium]
MTRRVVVTGMGWITPLGHDIPTAWGRLLAGENAIGPVTRYDASAFATNFAAEVKGFDLADHLRDPALVARHGGAGIGTQMALAAAGQAWRQAGLGDAGRAPVGVDRHRIGMYLGAGEGSLDYDNFWAANLAGWNAESREVDSVAWAAKAHERMSPVREMEQEPNAALAHLASAFGCRGPAFNCMTACAASTQAIGEAFEQIRRGDADVMLAGGAHSMIHTLGMTGFIRLTAMSKRRESPHTAARPFDKTRDGFVMGEGAGVIILESLESAERRGATPVAELAGYGSSADAFRITDMHPDGKGPLAAMVGALRQAGINPLEPRGDGRPPVDYVSAHGTGTKENDSIETRALKQAFGSQAPRLAVSSIKSMMGHLIQAAGVVEFITCVQAIHTGMLPPTMNLHTPDPDLDLDYVPNQARDMNPAGGVDVCLSNSFGFGGQNDTVVVRRFS